MQKRILTQNVLKGIAALGIVLFFLDPPGKYYVLIGSLAALFLGLTDFGRQCPLILSVRYHLNRIKSKRQS
jgi:hypothetical protein